MLHDVSFEFIVYERASETARAGKNGSIQSTYIPHALIYYSRHSRILSVASTVIVFGDYGMTAASLTRTSKLTASSHYT